jgi:ATP-binding cassette, subfamily B, bacterial
MSRRDDERSAQVADYRATDVLRAGLRTTPQLRVGLLVTLTLALVGAMGRVVVPILVQQVVDRGLRNPDDVAGTTSTTSDSGARARSAVDVDLGVVWVICAVAVVVVAVTVLATAATKRRLARAAETAIGDLRVEAFAHVHSLSLAHHTDEHRGVLVSRVTSDLEALSQFFSWGGLAMLIDGAVVVTVVTTMVVYDWRLALVAVVSVLPLALVLRLLQRHLIRAYDAVRDRVGEMLSAVSEAVTGAAVVRGYHIQERTNAKVRRAVEGRREAEVRAGTISAFMFPANEVFAVITISAVVVAGIWLGPTSGLSTGELVAFLFLVGLLLEPVSEFTEVLDQTQTAIAGWRKVLDLLATPLEIVEPVPGVELPRQAPRIDLEHVSFGYRRPADLHEPPAVLALRDVSLVIEPGQHVAVVGATGSGKTTLAKLLTRLADPTAGRVLVDGIDLREVSSSSLRSCLVMVPQESFLFDTTVADNVRYARPNATDDEVRLAFVELGLEGWVDGLPHGLHTPVGERGEHLSVGERQLVALARAYVANPTCLILDEATSSVDAATETRLARALQSLAEGRTSVTIAHRLSTAERADTIVVMAHGRVVEHGPHDDLLARHGVYAGLHDSWITGTSSGGNDGGGRHGAASSTIGS